MGTELASPWILVGCAFHCTITTTLLTTEQSMKLRVSHEVSQRFFAFRYRTNIGSSDNDSQAIVCIVLSYDNMCHVDGMRVAKKPLPRPSPYDRMWMDISKIINSLHIRNQKTPLCNEAYDTAVLKASCQEATQ